MCMFVCGVSEVLGSETSWLLVLRRLPVLDAVTQGLLRLLFLADSYSWVSILSCWCATLLAVYGRLLDVRK